MSDDLVLQPDTGIWRGFLANDPFSDADIKKGLEGARVREDGLKLAKNQEKVQTKGASRGLGAIYSLVTSVPEAYSALTSGDKLKTSEKAASLVKPLLALAYATGELTNKFTPEQSTAISDGLLAVNVASYGVKGVTKVLATDNTTDATIEGSKAIGAVLTTGLVTPVLTTAISGALVEGLGGAAAVASSGVVAGGVIAAAPAIVASAAVGGATYLVNKDIDTARDIAKTYEEAENIARTSTSALTNLKGYVAVHKKDLQASGATLKDGQIDLTDQKNLELVGKALAKESKDLSAIAKENRYSLPSWTGLGGDSARDYDQAKLDLAKVETVQKELTIQRKDLEAQRRIEQYAAENKLQEEKAKILAAPTTNSVQTSENGQATAADVTKKPTIISTIVDGAKQVVDTVREKVDEFRANAASASPEPPKPTVELYDNGAKIKFGENTNVKDALQKLGIDPENKNIEITKDGATIKGDKALRELDKAIGNKNIDEKNVDIKLENLPSTISDASKEGNKLTSEKVADVKQESLPPNLSDAALAKLEGISKSLKAAVGPLQEVAETSIPTQGQGNSRSGSVRGA